MSIDIIGLIAGVCTTISAIPQILQVIRSDNAEGLSMTTYTIHSAGLVMWIAYGALSRNLLIIAFNGVTLFMNCIIMTACALDRIKKGGRREGGAHEDTIGDIV